MCLGSNGAGVIIKHQHGCFFFMWLWCLEGQHCVCWKQLFYLAWHIKYSKLLHLADPCHFLSEVQRLKILSHDFIQRFLVSMPSKGPYATRVWHFFMQMSSFICITWPNRVCTVLCMCHWNECVYATSAWVLFIWCWQLKERAYVCVWKTMILFSLTHLTKYSNLPSPLSFSQ